MNVVVLQGTLSSDPVSRVLASGSVLVSLELTTVVDGCSVSVPVAWFDPPLETAWAAGQSLLVTGTVRRRFFRTGVVPTGRRRAVRAALARAVAQLLPDGG